SGLLSKSDWPRPRESMAMTRRGDAMSFAKAGASAAKSLTVRVSPGRHTTGTRGAVRLPYSCTCRRRPSCAVTKMLRPSRPPPVISSTLRDRRNGLRRQSSCPDGARQLSDGCRADFLRLPRHVMIGRRLEERDDEQVG